MGLHPETETVDKRWILEPALQLCTQKGVSLGHSIITSLYQILVTHLTIRHQTLLEETKLGRIEEVEFQAMNALSFEPEHKK